MDDSEILTRIRTMVDAEHALRADLESTESDSADAQSRLRELEASLDQCWDLLRQRRAHREFNQNPDESQARPVDQVEHYLQ